MRRLAYDAATDGWSAAAFHRSVDTFGAALVVAETTGGAVIGGYNPRGEGGTGGKGLGRKEGKQSSSLHPAGWIGLGEDRDSQAAFLFTWRDGDTSKRAVKLPKVGGAAQAVIDKESSGPQFGPDGLKIALLATAPRQVRIWVFGLACCQRASTSQRDVRRRCPSSGATTRVRQTAGGRCLLTAK